MSDLATPPLPDASKRDRIRRIFGRVAGRYDRINSLISFGMHHRWRRFAILQSRLPTDAWALDVATGTADFVLEFASRGAHAVGIDPSAPMLAAGAEKIRDRQLSSRTYLVVGEAERLPVPSGRFDCATIGFGLRNVSDIDATFREMARAVRPGGRVVALEIAKPRHRMFRSLFLLYFYRLSPLIASLLGGDREAYAYLPDSLKGFSNREELAVSMERAGLTEVRWFDLTGGSVCVHVGTKP